MTDTTNLRQQSGVCSECKGSGRTGSGYLREDCPACKGTGRQPAQPASLLRPAVVASAADCQKPQLVVTRGDGVPLPDQAAALAEFKRQCLQPAQPASAAWTRGRRKCGCVYATARNTAAVRKGFSMGGYVKEFCAEHRPTQPGSGEVCLCHLKSCRACRYKTDVEKATELRDYIHGLHNQLTAAQQREAVLRTALREYGGHLDDCAGTAGALDPRCTCGFRAALTAAQQRIAELDDAKKAPQATP